MKFEIKHRFSGDVVFVADIACEENAPFSLKMGLAVRAALVAEADLSKANLSEADLSKANLSKADLSKANLSEADLSKANLSEADLSWADLSKANLSKADLSKADLSKADLSKANLSKADLSKANLSKANLSEANLSWADLSKANLSEANLSWADLRYIKHDIWGIMLRAIPEVPALREAVIGGRINGSQYAGECACLCGTIAKERGVGPHDMADIKTDSTSLAERFFMGIQPGDTPETNPASKLVLDWIDEFLLIVGQNNNRTKA